VGPIAVSVFEGSMSLLSAMSDEALAALPVLPWPLRRMALPFMPVVPVAAD
jgi:hypothetical protein